MDTTELTKVISTVVALLGTLIVWLHNREQSKKNRADLLKEIDEAIKAESKHRTCELFRILYGLRYKYQDIKLLLDMDDASRILGTLSQYPGVITYEDGNFSYTDLFKKPSVNIIDKLLTKGGNVSAILIIFVGIIGIFLTSGVLFGISLVAIFLPPLLLLDNYKQSINSKYINTLIKNVPRPDQEHS